MDFNDRNRIFPHFLHGSEQKNGLLTVGLDGFAAVFRKFSRVGSADSQWRFEPFVFAGRSTALYRVCGAGRKQERKPRSPPIARCACGKAAHFSASDTGEIRYRPRLMLFLLNR